MTISKRIQPISFRVFIFFATIFYKQLFRKNTKCKIPKVKTEILVYLYRKSGLLLFQLKLQKLRINDCKIISYRFYNKTLQQ